MPEGPELRLAANFINKVASQHSFSGKVIKSDLATKLPEVPFEAITYSLLAESRGKELKVYLNPQDDNSDKKKKTKPKQKESLVTHLLFRFGMSGCFKLTSVKEIPKHAHLRFFTKNGVSVLSYVDYRRFGSWTINGDWGVDRGPDPITDYEEFRANVLGHLEDSAFNRPICETLLNQKYFNGVGNYLRAEILFRCKIPPFTLSRSVLEPLASIEVKTEDPDILELCHSVPKEVLLLGTGKGYDVEPDPDEQEAFTKWLQCYYVDGMNNLVDHNNRTIWFKGPAGAMKPSSAKTRGKRTIAKKKPVKKELAESKNEPIGHDYEPKTRHRKTACKTEK